MVHIDSRSSDEPADHRHEDRAVSRRKHHHLGCRSAARSSDAQGIVRAFAIDDKPISGKIEGVAQQSTGLRSALDVTAHREASAIMDMIFILQSKE